MFIKFYDYEWDSRDTADLSFLPNCSALISVSFTSLHAYYSASFVSYLSFQIKLSILCYRCACDNFPFISFFYRSIELILYIDS